MQPTFPKSKEHIFQITAIFSMVFALVGFSYNVWRMEVTEYNSTMRSASFELLLQLSELEGIIYAAYYDKDQIAGNPRKGWIKVNLIADLSMITEPELQQATQQLKQEWQQDWDSIGDDETSVKQIIAKIDNTREEVRQLLSKLD
ncbi:hypothetical protein FM037_19985 [Shewanella psychropiezotolerans]|uniref:Uncharacterized protein n=1 Tax=Shewanella psychropiezotolerans TaxID=2593655 RepID=A0ABX5X2Y7_9GAMM|nr:MULTISPECIES: hypothetical protein [Shewanella]MPY21251.1 hypothetical protein [Shewanella sp. YLB-07]MPY22038.1 hypothetical protein [Shewanella sp. YLB-07]QDO85097.1 hypothetical protein FM037_19985 [Shewanella psychropiezotolerans]